MVLHSPLLSGIVEASVAWFFTGFAYLGPIGLRRNGGL